jgi:hypothetical protein
MIGVETGTTAFPHGNRGIDVYEWDDTGTRADTALPKAGGNIWMYAGSVAQRSAAESNVGSLVYQKSYKVIQGAVSHGSDVGNINDGVCLKCHVATDLQSARAMGVIAPMDTEIPSDAMNVPRHAGFEQVWQDMIDMGGDEDDPLQTLFIYFYR